MKLYKLLISFFLVSIFFSCSEANPIENEKKDVVIEEVESIIPENLITNFKTNFSNATDVEWEVDGENFEVEYEESGLDKSIVFNLNGDVIESETEIKVENLPQSVLDYIQLNYADYSLEEAEEETKDNSVTYEIEILKEGNEIELLFDTDGNFLNQEVGDNEDEDEDDKSEQ